MTAITKNSFTTSRPESTKSFLLFDGSRFVGVFYFDEKGSLFDAYSYFNYSEKTLAELLSNSVDNSYSWILVEDLEQL